MLSSLTRRNDDRLIVIHFSCDSMLQIFDVVTGQQLGVNESGEVYIRCNANMKGYLNNDQATRQTIDGKGWLHTGILNDQRIF